MNVGLVRVKQRRLGRAQRSPASKPTALNAYDIPNRRLGRGDSRNPASVPTPLNAYNPPNRRLGRAQRNPASVPTTLNAYKTPNHKLGNASTLTPLPLLLTCLLITPPTLADTSAQAIALNCRNCHTTTNTATTVPSIDTLTKQQIHDLLLDFKYDKKPATIMSRITKGYSDAELTAVAELLGKH